MLKLHSYKYINTTFILFKKAHFQTKKLDKLKKIIVNFNKDQHVYIYPVDKF